MLALHGATWPVENTGFLCKKCAPNKIQKENAMKNAFLLLSISWIVKKRKHLTKVCYF